MQITNLNITTFLIFVSVLVFILFIGYKSYNKQLLFNNKFKLLSSSKFFYVKYIFLFLSFLTVFLSIFGFKIGEKINKNANNGIDMTFVVDVSKSMNVADINDSKYAYTRLDVVKDAISKFVSTHKQDRFGLIIFAGDAISTVPLTNDHDLFLTFLQNIDYRNLTKQGSDFEKALSLGVDRFNYSDDRSKAMIFISDGGDPEDKINQKNIKTISKNVKGIKYFVVGVGTNNGGKIITGKDFWGRFDYQKYNGEYVISKINKTNLKDIANSLDGEYYTVSDVGDLGNLNNSINKLEKKVLETDINGEKGDGGRILAIISFIFFMIFMGLYIIKLPEYNREK